MTPAEPVQDVLFVDGAAIGARLRQARERCGFDVAHVAGELHLRPRQLLALESGDFSGFNSPAFIKGYLRACARLLDENGDELVRLYESTNPVPRPVLTVSPVLAPKVVAAHASGRRTVVPTLLLACLLALGVFYMYQSGSWQPFLQVDAAPAAVQLAISAPVSVPAVDVADAAVAQGDGALTAAEAVSADTVSIDTATRAADQSPATVAPVPSGGVAAGTGEMVAGAMENPTETPTATAVPGPALQLSFTGDCWVQLRRDNGDVVHEKLHKAGDTASIGAALPLNVWFGNAAVVSMRLHGKDIPVPVKPGYQSARFVLDEEMAESAFE